MNLAELDRLLVDGLEPVPGDPKKKTMVMTKDVEKLHSAMVDTGGIAYFEFPVLIQANQIRNELVLRQTEFQKFKEDPNSKIFPEEELAALKNQWKAVLRDVGNRSGKEYRERGEWALQRTEINLLHNQILAALCNAMFPEEFIEGAGAPSDYDETVMEHIRIISKLENDWTLREKFPVTFSENDLDTWQDCIIDGSPKKYWLPRQRFKRLKGGIWTDKWMTEILGKEFRPNVKFLDRHARWIEEYMEENSI